ncbi:MAG TPA: helix-turn-helix domain-containing protein [Polyangiales bacterium]|nr:helix-turn-helix domain-containing protein [Polyangiales bacterium]
MMGLRATNSGRIRVRRSADTAKELILEAAEYFLVEHGPGGVSLRAVANRVGMTDAGVHHHFGSRDGLLEALLARGAARLRSDLTMLTLRWQREGARITQLVEALAAFYRSGYSQLAIAVHNAGALEFEHGMLEPVVDALHAARLRRSAIPAPDRRETQLAVAALHQALALEPSCGDAFRRSAGLTSRAASDPSAYLAWWALTLATMLGLPK